ncbi:MAG TPA: MFS transporter [Acidobacteriota bacterium]|nr:MFS transporter [Acidobacteriota bacterium]
MITAVYNVYFVSVVAENRPAATLIWTLALSASYLLVLVTAPLLGAIADYSACKKQLLVWTTSLCVLATAALATTGRGDIWLASGLIIVSNTFYAAGENLIAAFLPELAPPEDVGKLSGYGWAWGYIGGLVALALCLVYLRTAVAGGATEAEVVPHTALIVAALFAVAAMPSFLWLRESRSRGQLDGFTEYIRVGFGRVGSTLREARRFGDLFRLLLCIGAYSAGVTVVSTVAGVYAQQVLQLTQVETISLLVVVNLSAAAGAFAFGYLQDLFGSKRTIALTLVLWTATTLGAAFIETTLQLFLIGNMAGIAIGSSQSAGRAMVALFSPTDKAAEFFGLWGMAVKAASIVGPLTYGITNYLTSSHRIAVAITTIFFLAGLALLWQVDEERGRRIAEAYVEG